MTAEVRIADRRIGLGHPVYFIADIAANHDGQLDRALELVHLAKAAGADAAKFQSFAADTIVSGPGFASLGASLSHQARWTKPVVDVYRAASIPDDWTPALKGECDRIGIDFFSTPYAIDKVDLLDPWVGAFKIGSGDITWLELIEHVASKQKPVFLACGASDFADVERAMTRLLAINERVVLMQCNTNYTGSAENFRYVHLNVLKTFAYRWPDAVLGLSDHTPGHATVLGAIALGARAIEKHFTDDRQREGPDHAFSMDPDSWREMIDRSRELESALGGTTKGVEPNEQEAQVVQRRCIRARTTIAAGTVITRALLDVLRPAPPDAIAPSRITDVVGRKARHAIATGSALRWDDLQ